jgi:tetratricopeptide (TPR) repeat protein
LSGAIAGAVVVIAVLASAGVLTWPGASRGGNDGGDVGSGRRGGGGSGGGGGGEGGPAEGGRDRGRDLERLAEILAENRRLRRTNPFGARDQLRMLLAVSPLLPPASDERRRVFDALAETHAHLRNHTEAYAAHAQSATIVEQWAAAERARKGGVNVRLVHEQIVSRVQMATDLYQSFRFDEALALTTDALSMEPPPAARRVLHKLESTVFECKGDFISALQRFEEALRHAGPENNAANIEETKQVPCGPPLHVPQR